MVHEVKSYKYKNLTPTQIFDIIIHTFFYWLRIIGGAVVYAVTFELDITEPLESVGRNDFLFLEAFNLFLFYIVMNSVVTGNVFAYYVSIIIMFHNAILTIFIPASPGPSIYVSTGEWISISIVSFLFLLEAIISVILAYLRRNIYSYNLFKKVGIDDKVNNAFAIRKCLQTLGRINVFLTLVMTIKFITPISISFRIVTSLSLGYTFLTIMQQFFISIKFDEEIIWMRRTAIILSIIKIPLPILMIIYRNNTFDGSTDFFASSFLYFLFADQIIITILVIYYLILDLNSFDSGLKNYLKIKAKKYDLNR